MSLLPLPGKLAERLMHTHISNFVENKGLLTDKQGGFRKGKLTIATIADLTDEIILGLNNKEFTLASFIDVPYDAYNGVCVLIHKKLGYNEN